MLVDGLGNGFRVLLVVLSRVFSAPERADHPHAKRLLLRSLPPMMGRFEIRVIAYVRSRYMDTPFLQAVFQIVLGGLIVLGAGIAIGEA